MLLHYLLVLSFLSSVISELTLHTQYGKNNTIILSYNLTSNYSYVITVRLFGNEQSIFGLFPPTDEFKENSIEIIQSSSPTDLIIICFHFIRRMNDLDIQCQDRSLNKSEENQSNPVFLPSYHPYFVPMMYALSILMLLPVIIQHHQQKKNLLRQRRKEIRRLSVSISQDKQNPQRKIAQKMLSQINQNGEITYGNIPRELDLISTPSARTLLDDHLPRNFNLKNLQPFIPKDLIRKKSTEVNAHDCVAHLLDHTPWTTPFRDSSMNTRVSRHPSVIKEQHVPIILSLDDDDDEPIPMFGTKRFSRSHLQQTNQAFQESDV